MAKQTALVPGDVLKKLLAEYNISVAKISEDIGLSPSAVRQLVNNKLKVSPIIALRLSKYFDKSAQYWIDLQNNLELSQLQNDAKTSASLKKIAKAKKQPAKASKTAKAAKKPRKAAGKRGPKAGAKAKVGAKPGAKKAGPGRKPAKKTGAAAAKKPRKPRTVKPKAKDAPRPLIPSPTTFPN
jgi:addiction module HigA family antidote